MAGLTAKLDAGGSTTYRLVVVFYVIFMFMFFLYKNPENEH